MKSLDDAFLPMYEKDIDQIADAKRLRDRHWNRLRSARLDLPKGQSLPDWVESVYGLKLHLENQMITDAYTVIDEAKYTMYLLKYGQ